MRMAKKLFLTIYFSFDALLGKANRNHDFLILLLWILYTSYKTPSLQDFDWVDLDIDNNLRPEEISLEEYLKLAESYKE